MDRQTICMNSIWFDGLISVLVLRKYHHSELTVYLTLRRCDKILDRLHRYFYVNVDTWYMGAGVSFWVSCWLFYFIWFILGFKSWF